MTVQRVELMNPSMRMVDSSWRVDFAINGENRFTLGATAMEALSAAHAEVRTAIHHKIDKLRKLFNERPGMSPEDMIEVNESLAALDAAAETIELPGAAIVPPETKDDSDVPQ